MKKMSFERRRTAFEKSGFYAAVCLCLIAVGVLSWSASGKKGADNNIASPETTLSYPAQSTQRAAEIVSNVPYSSAVKNSEPEKSSSVASKVPSGASSVASKPASPYFIMPLGGNILKGFDDKAPQYSETYKDWRIHRGIDIASVRGTAVYAAGDGTVSEIYADAMLGTVVKIDHGGGIIAYYCGLNKKPGVTIGQQVDSSVQIGAVDTVPCEAVEPEHLHLAMTLNGKWVSPLDIIKE